jgi:hypothetical protein
MPGWRRCGAGAVELAVARAVETAASLAVGGGIERSDAGLQDDLGVRAKRSPSPISPTSLAALSVPQPGI